MGLFGSGNNSGGLTPAGIGGGPSEAQKQLFANAAQDSGLAAMGMGMVDQMTGGQAMQNEDQVKLLYQLMAAHILTRLHFSSMTTQHSFLNW